jgi:deoxyhypusine synthase
MTSKTDLEVIPPGASAAVLQRSHPISDDAISVQGPNFDTPLSLQQFLQSYERIGFQANSLGRAIDIVNKMVGSQVYPAFFIRCVMSQRKWRLSDEPLSEDESGDLVHPEIRAQTRCNIFLGYTSNLVSSGLREIILHLVKHKHVAVLVTTAGGIEEDFIKCLGKTYLADFNLDGADLRRRGMNRIGNLIVPNDNYCKFEDWLMPILDSMLAEQKQHGTVWTPSSFIRRLGKEINNEESIYYWAYKVIQPLPLSDDHLSKIRFNQNDVPVYCPALTDGSIGDMIYFHSFRSPGFILDIVQDIRDLNEHSRTSRKAGMIILGGGVCKHQVANAMLIVLLHFSDILQRAD